MNKLTKRIAIIAGVGVFAVVIATGVTFVSAQKNATFAFFSENMEALAKSESSGSKLETCYMEGTNVLGDGAYHCAAGTLPDSPGTAKPCSGNIKKSFFSEEGKCIKQ